MNPAKFRQIPELTDKDKIRFWSKVDKRLDGVWNWTSTKSGRHYGVFGITLSRGVLNNFFAHRISWALRERELGRSGFIPQGMCVCHRNDVTPDLFDVNPENLWLGTRAENMLDKARKGRCNSGIGLAKIRENRERRKAELI